MRERRGDRVDSGLSVKGEGRVLRYLKEALGWGDGSLGKGLAMEV